MHRNEVCMWEKANYLPDLILESTAWKTPKEKIETNIKGKGEELILCNFSFSQQCFQLSVAIN